MEASLASQRCQPASTSGRSSPSAAAEILHSCPHAAGRQLALLRTSKALPARGPWLRSATRDGSAVSCSSRPGAASAGAWRRCNSPRRRDVSARARSTAGQVGVAAVEEVVEATHFEVLSSLALPSSLRRQRDSYLNLENLESLTSELAEATQDLQLLEKESGPADLAVSGWLLSSVSSCIMQCRAGRELPRRGDAFPPQWLLSGWLAVLSSVHPGSRVLSS